MKSSQLNQRFNAINVGDSAFLPKRFSEHVLQWSKHLFLLDSLIIHKCHNLKLVIFKNNG